MKVTTNSFIVASIAIAALIPCSFANEDGSDKSILNRRATEVGDFDKTKSLTKSGRISDHPNSVKGSLLPPNKQSHKDFKHEDSKNNASEKKDGDSKNSSRKGSTSKELKTK